MDTPAAPTRLRFDHLDAPVLGTGNPEPRLSWQVPSAPDGWRQRGSQIEVTRDDGRTQLFDRDDAEQVLVPWPAAPLTSREAATVRVRVRGGNGDGGENGSGDEDGAWSAWSEPARVEAGLLDPADWQAVCIGPAEADGPAPVLGASVELDEVVSARLYVTALGLYRARINGRRVGTDELAPGWTAYQARLPYRTFDVTDHLRAGRNDLELLVGNGWWSGRIGYEKQRGKYGSERGALAQLEVVTASGRRVLATGEHWRAGRSGILADDLFDGQTTDLTAAPPQLSEPVRALPLDPAVLVAPTGPAIAVTEEVAAVELSEPRPGVTRIDFGQNLVGWVRLAVRGADGGEVVVRHAEVLEHGELGVRPLRTARATDRYLLPADGGEHVLEPCFTFHGFRYAEVTGVAGLRPEDVQAVVLHSDLRRTGWFECSDERLNQLHRNVVWGMRGNFVGVPTDCPQRDERLGWTGDIQVFAPTATYLFDTAGFLQSWLGDVSAEQHPDGTVPWVVPDVLTSPSPPTAAWGDAAVVVPDVLHRAYGDADVLRTQLGSMRGWVDRVAAEAGADLLWTGGFQFGDWLDPAAPPDDPFAARVDADLVATACFARCARILADAAAVVGAEQDARRYGALADGVREAFAAQYVTPGGRMVSDSVTAYAMALEWDLLPDAARPAAGRRLADLVRAEDFRVATGFVGTPLVTDALTRAGYPEVAYRLLLQTDCPSWLYQVQMGATTIWERWDSMLPDGTINPGQMTSFNHYALGAVADWLHRTVAGLAIGAPGYREVVVRPVPTRRLDHASTRHASPYGEIRVGWSRRGTEVGVHAELPVGVSATVWLPGAGQPQRVGPGSHEWVVADPSLLPREIRTIADVLDDAELWRRVVEVVAGPGEVSGAGELAARLGRYLGASVADLALRAAPPFKAHLAEQLRPRLDAVLAEAAASR
ncbi:Bacterial alpha-L-rhamnosidase [Auraticoccus sp. F435]|uniref:alpha-L-rhamnosidase n=1 Tax=Auraticoccus cholistanensis TaxID=2656650 RepID=A0A6A9USN1_9ACTN|nr:alpha-L-rhamnosidase [Auraticoccus cholistanensis]MVA74692.1 Bacterial alpha-L-rhamnosidase [Auraticoccus cholistanensis]